MKTSTNFPQLQKRSIGKIKIIDVKGDLVGPWALRMKEEIHSMVKEESENTVVINLRPIQNIDSLGAKAILESMPKDKPAGFLNGKISVMEMIDATATPREVLVFKNEEELIERFGKDLVAHEEDQNNKRKYSRIPTALPLKFRCKNSQDEVFEFKAVITNLSEGGLFAEYINLDDALKSQSIVNPYELNMLDLEIKLPSKNMVKAKGKVVRRKLDGEQVGIGIEFYEINEEERGKIKTFLSNKF